MTANINTALQILLVSNTDAFVVTVLSDEPKHNQGRGLVDRKLVKAPPPPAILLLAVPRRLFSFGSLAILDVVCRYLSFYMSDQKTLLIQASAILVYNVNSTVPV